MQHKTIKASDLNGTCIFYYKMQWLEVISIKIQRKNFTSLTHKQHHSCWLYSLSHSHILGSDSNRLSISINFIKLYVSSRKIIHYVNFSPLYMHKHNFTQYVQLDDCTFIYAPTKPIYKLRICITRTPKLPPTPKIPAQFMFLPCTICLQKSCIFFPTTSLILT